MVGGGTAGAALAARLAQLPGSVLLLEAGSDPPVESIVSTDQSYFIYFHLKSLHMYIHKYLHTQVPFASYFKSRKPIFDKYYNYENTLNSIRVPNFVI